VAINEPTWIEDNMPQGPEHLHEKWQSDEKAMRFLQDRGYTITRGFEWKRPNVYHQPTEEEMEAMDYLVLEWDFGWMCDLDFGPQDRERVYMAVDSERDYQDAQAGNAKRHEDQPPMTPGEFILCMEKCLQDARDAWYKPDGGRGCMEYIRKVTALGVQAMERHGAPKRVMPKPKVNVSVHISEETPVRLVPVIRPEKY
jgi:hypothetical protein